MTRSPEQGCLTHSRTLNHSEPMGKAPRQVLPQAPARPPVHTCFSRPRAFLHYLGREKNTRTQMLGFQGTRDRGQLSFCVPNVLRKPRSQDVVWGSGAGQAQSPQGSRRPGAGVPGPRRGRAPSLLLPERMSGTGEMRGRSRAGSPVGASPAQITKLARRSQLNQAPP